MLPTIQIIALLFFYMLHPDCRVQHVPGATAATVMPLNIQPFINHPERTPNTDAPKAFLSYMLLDEVELKLVSTVYGSTALPTITGGMTAQVMQAAGGAEINITKNGYLFVFVSNEMERMRNSPNP